MTTAIDGKNAVLGRLASLTAKKLLAGEEVVIVNAEKALVTGSPSEIMKKYIERKRRGSPQHGPFFPKQPERIVSRTIRGMLPKTGKGRAAMKRLRIFAGAPDEYSEAKSLAVKQVRSDFMKVGEIAKNLGWRG